MRFMYAVVIGDIVRSRESSDRKALQRQLGHVVAHMNDRAGNSRFIMSPYTITLGDEVQSVYSAAATAVLDILAFRAHMRPVDMRFCIGVGEIATQINKKAAIGMDGPAFHVARSGIEQLKTDGTAAFAVKAQSGIDVDLEDAAVKLMDVMMRAWRPTRFAVLSAALQGKADTRKIATGLGISRAGVYKNLADGHIDLLIDAATATGRSLAHKITRARRPG